MKIRIVMVFILAALVLSGVGVTNAAARPVILKFESSVTSITLPEAEAGSVTTTLSWSTAGFSLGYELELLTYRLDQWEKVLDPAGVALEANGSREVVVQHPMNFGPPMFLLSMVETDTKKIVDQRVISIPYAVTGGEDSDAPAEPVAVTLFAADVEAIAAADVLAGSARVGLTWSVENRAPNSHLFFEQVLADGSAGSVELPRLNLWVPSEGQGPVAPIAEDGADTLTLRLRVVDLVSGEVLAEDSLELAISGEMALPEEPDVPEEPVGRIEAFTAMPNKLNPGGAVTLTWDVQGTDGVLIDQVVPNVKAVTTVVSAQQSPQGTATVYLPVYAAYSVSFVLRTVDGTSTATAVVEVNCPYTFYFGAADGCPTGGARQVGASYQEFEGGFMLWRADSNEIYVFYSDGEMGGTAAYFIENYFGLLPEVELSEVPPLDRYVPVAGFSKVWANVPEVRAGLGWALGPEQGYTMTVQSVSPNRTPPPAVTLYFTLPDDGGSVGTGYGTWKMVE